MKSRPPLHGYNHNIRHGSHTFHVQTEDSGLQSPRLHTHLFFGGTILASKRCEYQPEEDDEVVQRRMQAQHKSMLQELRAGQFDERIAQFFSSPSGQLAAARFEAQAAAGQAPAVSEDAETLEEKHDAAPEISSESPKVAPEPASAPPASAPVKAPPLAAASPTPPPPAAGAPAGSSARTTPSPRLTPSPRVTPTPRVTPAPRATPVPRGVPSPRSTPPPIPHMAPAAPAIPLSTAPLPTMARGTDAARRPPTVTPKPPGRDSVIERGAQGNVQRTPPPVLRPGAEDDAATARPTAPRMVRSEYVSGDLSAESGRPVTEAYYRDEQRAMAGRTDTVIAESPVHVQGLTLPVSDATQVRVAPAPLPGAGARPAPRFTAPPPIPVDAASRNSVVMRSTAEGVVVARPTVIVSDQNRMVVGPSGRNTPAPTSSLAGMPPRNTPSRISGRSIFSEDDLETTTLDEAIRAYLSDDPEEK